MRAKPVFAATFFIAFIAAIVLPNKARAELPPWVRTARAGVGFQHSSVGLTLRTDIGFERLGGEIPALWQFGGIRYSVETGLSYWEHGHESLDLLDMGVFVRGIVQPSSFGFRVASWTLTPLFGAEMSVHAMQRSLQLPEVGSSVRDYAVYQDLGMLLGVGSALGPVWVDLGTRISVFSTLSSFSLMVNVRWLGIQ